MGIMKRTLMPSEALYCGLFSAVLFLTGTSSVNAVEYGEVVQKDGKWEFKNTEDPVLKYMHDKHVITDEDYFKATDRTGKNWPKRCLFGGRSPANW